MENNEDGEEPVTRGNEWEVVSLTESAYGAGAAPGPKEDASSHNSQGKLSGENKAETSTAMLISGHFVFPPSQHENLPLEPESVDIQNEGKDDASRLIVEEGGNRLFVSGTDFKKDLDYDKEQSIYSSAASSSVYNEADLVNCNIIEEVGRIDDMIEDIDRASDSSICSLEKPVEGDNYDGYNLPCEAWWKRRVVSLYAHAKEANTFWSVCIAAAVMGLVIIGHRWQQERWQILHLKWQSGIKHECKQHRDTMLLYSYQGEFIACFSVISMVGSGRMGMMLGQMSRLKDVIVGGHRRGSLVRGNSSI